MKRILPLLILFIPIIAKPQQALTFENCLELAMSNNLRLQGASFTEKIAVVQYRASYGQLLPEISAAAENRHSWGKEIDSDTNLFVNDNLTNTEGSITAGLNLFSGFAAHNSIKLARQEVAMNRAGTDQIRNEITIDLAQRFITILYLQEIIVANLDQIASSQKQLELAELKFSAGVISESEVFKIKSQKASEEFNLLANQNLLADNLINIKQLMNLPLEQEIVLLKPELNLNKNLLLDEDQFSLTNKAVEVHPAFRVSMISQEMARTELAIARAARYPTLDMKFTYRSNYTPNDELPTDLQIEANTSEAIRFSLNIPIFSRFETSSNIKSSKFNYKRSKIETQIEYNRISKEVLKAITDAKTSLKKNESSNMAFEFSQKSYDADLLKFQLGKININELNTTKVIYNKSQAELIQSKYELLFNNALIKFYAGESFSL